MRVLAPSILIATVTAHLFGGSAGREGTAVQMGAAIGAGVAKFATKTREAGHPRPSDWTASYVAIWGKLPGETLTPEEYAGREPLWNEWVAKDTAKQPQRQNPPPVTRPVAALPSLGRNQPCLCGSGRKFKKCCGG